MIEAFGLKRPEKIKKNRNILFLSPQAVAALGFDDLFTTNNDPNQRCAVGVNLGPDGEITDAVIVLNVSSRKFFQDSGYRKRAIAQVGKLFDSAPRES